MPQYTPNSSSSRRARSLSDQRTPSGRAELPRNASTRTSTRTVPDLSDLSQLSPADILRLQRSVGNRAVAQMVQRTRQRGETAPTAPVHVSSMTGRAPTIQRVGHTPFGYTFSENPSESKEIAGHQKEFQKFVEELRGEESVEKDKTERWLRTGDRHGRTTTPASVPRNRLFGKDKYADQLRKIGLTQERVVNSGRIAKYGFTYNKDDQTIYYKDTPIAKLHSGDDAFELADPQPQGVLRAVYVKRGKQPGEKNEYVKDDREVFTRRYAYVEKNKYQTRTMLQTGKMTGQYQDKLSLLGSTDTKYTMDSQLQNMYELPQGKTGLEPSSMAFVHQEKGSGYQQRGLSLRSTPKEVYGNQGESFRSKEGVELRLDLAKVPPGNDSLLNHYGSGGLKDSAEDLGHFKDRNTQRPYKDNTHYQDSVTKNRELYLDTLTPDMIVGTTYHRDKDTRDRGREDVQMIGDTPQQQMQSLATQINFDKFHTGYDQGYYRKKYPKEKYPEEDSARYRKYRKQELDSPPQTPERREGQEAGEKFYEGKYGRKYRPYARTPKDLADIEKKEKSWDFMVGVTYGEQKKDSHFYSQAPYYKEWQ